jgi:hypothetical protein
LASLPHSSFPSLPFDKFTFLFGLLGEELAMEEKKKAETICE